MKVAVTGATGFVGSRLVERLQTEGHQIIALSRNAAKARQVFPTATFPSVEIVEYTPLASGPWQQSLSGCDAVVNLAGEPLAEQRWTPEHKQRVIDSRRIGTEKIVEAIVQAQPRPQVLINASAIGYYGTSETATFDETSPAGNDFLADVCKQWETAATPVQESGVRLVILRIGIVLGMGGAIAKMLTPFKLFAGGPIGTGRQWFSWIHRDDLVSLILTALTTPSPTTPSLSGTFNATAPTPVKMADFCSQLGAAMNRPSWLPVPAIALEVLLGDGAQVVLEGQEVLPKRVLATGFTYRYAEVKAAIAEILSANP
jgi:uncharacterized protein